MVGFLNTQWLNYWLKFVKMHVAILLKDVSMNLAFDLRTYLWMEESPSDKITSQVCYN